jgi:putative DNA primase/helicase
MVITGEKLDADPWLLGCENGVVDLRTGRHRPGRPDDWITKTSPVEWKGLDAPAPTWERFLLEIMDGDRDRVDYLRRALGYGVTGLTREHILMVFFGSGRNGKGALLETAQGVLGPLAGAIQSEMLLNQGRVRNSAGPSPDIMSLKGKRIVIASETERGQHMAAARVKSMASSDTLTGRNPHDRCQISFRPSHLLILATNFKPKANADDPALWARMQLVEFPLSFVDHPVAPNERLIDRTLEDKLLAEYPGILAWFVRGCLEWQVRGLDPPRAVVEATAAYRRTEDDLADFLEEKCIVSENSQVSAKAIYSAFKDWFTSTVADKAPSQKRFGEMLGLRFQKDTNGPGKTVRYYGLELRDSLG